MLILQFVFSFFFHKILPEHRMRNFKDYAVDQETASFQNCGMLLYSTIQQTAWNSHFFW